MKSTMPCCPNCHMPPAANERFTYRGWCENCWVSVHVTRWTTNHSLPRLAMAEIERLLHGGRQ